MSKKICTIACLFLLVAGKINSQVSLQTGSATFGLSMFNWKDDKSRLGLNLGINYSSGSGLRVDDVASNIGQGWGMQAGGVIMRSQAGEPDDQVAYNTGKDDVRYDYNRIPAGILFTKEPRKCPLSEKYYPLFKEKNCYYSPRNPISDDRQQDIFTFQFNGKSGSFVIDPANSGKGYTIGDSKLKITYEIDNGLLSKNIRTVIASFTIQDVDGLIYRFKNHGLGKVLETSYSTSDGKNLLAQPNIKDGRTYYQSNFESELSVIRPYIINSWFLSEIEDPFTRRKVKFKYDIRNINTPTGVDININKSTNVKKQKTSEHSIITFNRSIAKNPAILAIECPDGHMVNFNYGKDRVDLIGDKVLSNVVITYVQKDSAYVEKPTAQGTTTSGSTSNSLPPGSTGYYVSVNRKRTVAKFIFNTSYIIKNRYGNPTTNFQKKFARLYLRSVQKVGPDLKEESQHHYFDYYTGGSGEDMVPPPFFYAKDIWGFYNAKNTSPSLDLNKDVTALSHSQLKELCFMSGSLSSSGKSGYAKNGLLKQVIFPTGGILTYKYEPNNATGYSNVGVHVSQTALGDVSDCGNFNTKYTNYIYDQADFWGVEPPLNSISSKNYYAAEVFTYRWKFGDILGSWKWKYQYPGILKKQDKVKNSVLQNINIGVQTALAVLNYLNVAKDIINITKNVGNATVVGLVITEVVAFLVDLIVTFFIKPKIETANTTYYNTNLNTGTSLPMQFKKVTIKDVGTNGKTVQEFTSLTDQALWQNDNSFYSAGRQRYAPWAYGLPKNSYVYNETGSLLSETNNVYSYTKNQLNSAVQSCNCFVNNSYSQRSDYWLDRNRYGSNYSADADIIQTGPYNYYSGRVELTSVTEKIYSTKGGSPLVNTTSYTYNANNYAINSTTKEKSNGEKLKNEIKYNDSYSGGVYDQLKSNNIYNEPIANTSYIGTAVLSEKVTELKSIPNGDIRPARVAEQRFTKPATTFTAFSGSIDTKYKTTQQFYYDNRSNLIKINDEAGRVVSNIYDYDDKFIVASIINADVQATPSAYTSFETSSTGGWSIEKPLFTDNVAITGNRSLALNNSKVQGSLSSTQSYILSFWAKTGSTITVSVGTLKKNTPTLNNFTYYEYLISSGQTAVSISGSGNIDELRLYAASARMRTVTYDILLGKTSECDENNRIIYYEYDKAGRLSLVKDENKHIVKLYEYNNAAIAKENGCTTEFLNNEISEVFTRNNCEAGYLGGEYTYAIAAGKYKSKISQYDADRQAEAELKLSGQSSANTSGTCQKIYYNVEKSKTETSECELGYKGGPVTYTVPAGRYQSIISQDDANSQAQDDIDANSVAYANDPVYANCTYTPDPDWSWEEGDPNYCQVVDGQPHTIVQVTDRNPNSSTYLQTQYVDAGPGGLCSGFDCNKTTISKTTFESNGHEQTATLTVALVNVPPGVSTFTISSSGSNFFFPGNTTTYTATITEGVQSFTVPISFDGRSTLSSETITISANGFANSCAYNVDITQLTFNCEGTYLWSSSFENNNQQQSDYLYVQLSQPLNHTTTFTISSDHGNFSSTETTQPGNGQTSFWIPIYFDGSSDYSTENITLSATDFINSCTETVYIENPEYFDCANTYLENSTFINKGPEQSTILHVGLSQPLNQATTFEIYSTYGNFSPTEITQPGNGQTSFTVPIKFDGNSDYDHEYIWIYGGGLENSCAHYVSITNETPDLSPNLAVLPTIFRNGTKYSVVTKVFNVTNSYSSGLISVYISKDNKLGTVSWDANTTSLGGTEVNNSVWTFDKTSHSGFYKFTSNAVIPPNSSINFGFTGVANTNNSAGTMSVSVIILSRSGGESNSNNNGDSESIEYFPQNAFNSYNSGFYYANSQNNKTQGYFMPVRYTLTPPKKTIHQQFEKKIKGYRQPNAITASVLYANANETISLKACKSPKKLSSFFSWGMPGKILIYPKHGTAVVDYLVGDGDISYTANPNYVGSDTIVYLSFIENKWKVVYQLIDVGAKGRATIPGWLKEKIDKEKEKDDKKINLPDLNGTLPSRNKDK